MKNEPSPTMPPPSDRKKSRASQASGRVLLQRSDWVRVALHQLAKLGPDAVNLQALSDKLGVTKGSFYWHFASKEELLDAMLEEWRLRATERVIQIVEERDSSSRERIYQLAALGVSFSIEDVGGSIELAMRTWAKSSKRVYAAVAAVDQQRLDYLINLYADALPGDDPVLMACIHSAFSAGLRQLLCLSDAEKLRLRRAALDKVFFAARC